ncbi:MAG: arginine--tRNA ligase [Acidobacteriota bacterium]
MLDPFVSAKDAVERAIRAALPAPPESIPLSIPTDPAHGDLTTPIALGLARSMQRPPREIAGTLADAIRALPEVGTVDVAGPGYVNIRFDRTSVVHRMLAPHAAPTRPGGKIVVEHTNINPNKAAHIGHLRNAVLGDTLARCLRAQGHTVEVQNYIDDTGVQVADALVALTELAGLDDAGVQALQTRAEQRAAVDGHGIDHDLWDLYARVTRWYEEDESRLQKRQQVIAALEHGDAEIAKLGRAVADAVVRCHLRTMLRLGIEYDLLPKESDILAHRFWQQAFHRLQESQAIVLSHEGKTAGCWIMNLPHAEEEDGGQEYEKVIVRSNGVVTYVGKDIAYQLWKFGLLGRDFEYARLDDFRYRDNKALYQTVPPGQGVASPPAFGRAETVYNVIDVRQAYLQRVVKQGLERLGHAVEATRSIHFSYEMVALSPQTAQQLRPDLALSDEERARPYLDMSGRRGLGVKADDLLDQLERKARIEVETRNPELSADDARGIALDLAIGALRYYMLRFGRNKVVAFDIDAALAFEGETGPYAQYALVRIARILDKLAEKTASTVAELREAATHASFDALPDDVALDHWKLVHRAARLPEAVRQAVDNLEFAVLAKYGFELAQEINGFYHRYPVLKEERDDVRTARVAVLLVAERSLREALGLMGVAVPARM